MVCGVLFVWMRLRVCGWVGCSVVEFGWFVVMLRNGYVVL